MENVEKQHLGHPEQEDGVGEEMRLAKQLEPPEEEFMRIVL